MGGFNFFEGDLTETPGKIKKKFFLCFFFFFCILDKGFDGVAVEFERLCEISFY